ncbi:T9SS type A sorting domain-containing protein [Candidatus Latescibacterota bacterium]
MKTYLIIILCLFCVERSYSQDIVVNMHGKITDEAGLGIYDAKVTVTSITHETSQNTFTDASGDYSIEIPLITRVENDRPQDFKLFQNYPNPFNPNTIIEFELNRAADVKLTIYNILGQSIRELINNEYNTGRFSVLWDGRDNGGMFVSSGLYFYRLQAGQYAETKKMLLLDGGIGGGSPQQIVGKSFSSYKISNVEEEFRIKIEKNGYLINGRDFIKVSSSDISIEQNFSLRPLGMQRALGYYLSDERGFWYEISPLDGSNPESIKGSNSTPKFAFSPDGNYFAYSHSRYVDVMELETGHTSQYFTMEGYGSISRVEWTPDSERIISYVELGGVYTSCIINKDGSNVQERPEFFARNKFYLNDNYHFIYVDSLKVYKSDLDGTPPEEILNLTEVLDYPDYIHPKTFAFNPHTNCLLTKSRRDDVWSLIGINIETSEISVIEKSDNYGDCIYSPDFSKIANIDGSNIVIIENNEKRVFPAKRDEEYFDYNGWSFSPGGEYIAYGRYIVGTSGMWVNKIHSQYILNIETEEIVFVDSWAIQPSWNPNFPY